jgi:hypothetical protein
MVLPQYDELTSEDDDGAPPFAREYDEEESREAYQRAAYREAIAHFLPLPRTSYLWSLWQERVARDRQERAARARADYRERAARARRSRSQSCQPTMLLSLEIS